MLVDDRLTLLDNLSNILGLLVLGFQFGLGFIQTNRARISLPKELKGRRWVLDDLTVYASFDPTKDLQIWTAVALHVLVGTHPPQR